MAPVVIRRWVQLVLLPLALLALWALARAVGTLFLVLVVAGVVALVLDAPVGWLSRRLPRPLAILIVYLGLIAFVVAVGVLLASPVATQIERFQRNLPSLIRTVNHDLLGLQGFLRRHGINAHFAGQGQNALQTLQRDLLKRSGDIVDFSRGLLSSVISVGIDLLLILVLSIYLLLYGRTIGALARRIVPDGDGTPDDDYPTLVRRAVSGYVRGELMLCLAVGGAAAIVMTVFGLLGLFPAGLKYGWFFGAFYGVMEFIPYLGPVIGPIPPLLVALFEHPISALWLLIAFLAIQQLEGHVLAPQLFRISLRINPIIIIVGLLVGEKLYGIAGALVALPVIAIIRVTIVYLRRHTVLEPWGTRLLDDPPAAHGPPRPPEPPAVEP